MVFKLIKRKLNQRKIRKIKELIKKKKKDLYYIPELGDEINVLCKRCNSKLKERKEPHVQDIIGKHYFCPNGCLEIDQFGILTEKAKGKKSFLIINPDFRREGKMKKNFKVKRFIKKYKDGTLLRQCCGCGKIKHTSNRSNEYFCRKCKD